MLDAFLCGGDQVVLSGLDDGTQLRRYELKPHESDPALDWRGEGLPSSILESGTLRHCFHASRHENDRQRMVTVDVDTLSGLYAVTYLDWEKFKALQPNAGGVPMDSKQEEDEASGEEEEQESGTEEKRPQNSEKMEEEPEDDDYALEIVEIRSLETGDLALPGTQARLRLEAADGCADHGPIKSIKLAGDYVLLHRNSDHAEVRQWKSTQPDPDSHFAIAWTISEAELQDVISVTLLSPCFVAIQTMADEDACEEDEDPPISYLRIHRLDQASSHLLAVFEIPELGVDPDPVNYDLSGADLIPGQEGLVVIASMASVVR